jgi:hypothetical protein
MFSSNKKAAPRVESPGAARGFEKLLSYVVWVELAWWPAKAASAISRFHEIIFCKPLICLVLCGAGSFKAGQALGKACHQIVFLLTSVRF